MKQKLWTEHKCRLWWQHSKEGKPIQWLFLPGGPGLGSEVMFTKEAREKGRKSLENIPYNAEAIAWTEQHFDPSYTAQWVPEKIPALILSGSDDLATPLEHFSKRPEYHRSNITLTEIPHAGHFPWIENPHDVRAAFHSFYEKL